MSTKGGPNVVYDELIFYYDILNSKSFKGEPTENLANFKGEKTGSNEYLPYFNGLDDIFDNYGLDGYYVSFEAKSPVPGSVILYTTDTSSRKYNFNAKTFQINTDWQYYSLPIENISIYDNTKTNNNLSFYGTYGSGRIITVRNLQLEKKDYSTPFTLSVRSSTESLLDLKNNNTIDLSNVSFNSNGFYFDGINNYININGDFQTLNSTDGIAIEFVFKMNTVTSVVFSGNIDLTNGWYQSPISTTSDLGAYLYFTQGGVVMKSSNNFYINSSNINKYHHVIMNYKWGDINNSYILIDGLDVTDTKISVNKFDSGGSSNLRLGIRNNSIWPHNGLLDIFKFYNKSLTIEESKKNFNALKNRFGIL